MVMYKDVINRILDLSETCQEAIAYIKGKLNEGHFQETLAQMSEVVEAFCQLEQALSKLPEQWSDNHLEQVTRQVQRSLEQIVNAYEIGHPRQVQEKLQFNLQPAFHTLHRALETVLRPYTLS